MQSDYPTKFLQLPEFQVKNLKITPQDYTFWLIKAEKSEKCPFCGKLSSKIHDRRRQMIQDLPIQNKITRLLVLKRRYRCPDCLKVFPETYRSIAPYARRTHRLEESIFSRHSCPFKWLAQEHGISPQTVARKFNLFADRELKARKPVPITALGIDENSFRKGSRYNTVITDLLGSPKLVEILSGKKTELLEGFFRNYPYCDLIRYAAMDMCPMFLKAVKRNCPQAYVIVDKFHVLSGITRILGGLRKKKFFIKLPARLSKKAIMKPYETLSKGEKELMDYLCRSRPEFAEVYGFKERFQKFYVLKNEEEARLELDELIGTAMQSGLREMHAFGRQLMKWGEYILNYFICKLTNARTEGINNKIKLIKRMSYGFRNFENFRRKVLLDVA